MIFILIFNYFFVISTFIASFRWNKVVYMHRKQRKPLVYTLNKRFSFQYIVKGIYYYLFINNLLWIQSVQ